jgi:hypothetical protein
MRKMYIVAAMLLLAVSLQSGMKFHTVPPKGRTGATGQYCNGCHGGATTNPINTGGGSISVTGLPTAGGYVAGQSYPFSITITHGAADRLRWGFSIGARNASGASIGTFSTTNPFAAVNSSTPATDVELSHLNTAIEAASNTYTFNNLVWTAPATPPTDANLIFYYVGNATNGNGGATGDFIYAGSTSTALPISLTNFTAAVRPDNAVELKWQTAAEQNSSYFEVEKSDDGQLFYPLTQITAAGNAPTGKNYGYVDRTASSYNRPILYRLKMVDKDGSYKQSKTVSIQLKAGATVVQNLFPGMVRSTGRVTATIISNENKPLRIDVIDISGKVLQTYKEQLTTGSNLIDFRMPANLPSEWVFVRFSGAGFRQVMPLVVNE